MIPLSKIIPVFIRIGATSFGAGANEVMIREIVTNRRWISLEEFSESLSFTTLAPGPFHVNLVIATGYRLSGFAGALGAVMAFIFPGFIAALAVAFSLESRIVGDFLSAHPGIVKGVLAAVAGLVLNAVWRLGDKAVKNRAEWIIILFAAAAIWIGKIPFLGAAIACGFIAFAQYLFISRLKRT